MGFEFLDLEIKDLILGDLSKLCAVKTLSYKKKYHYNQVYYYVYFIWLEKTILNTSMVQSVIYIWKVL